MKTFDQLPDSARIWFYTSIAPLTADQKAEILSRTREFLDAWTSHDQKMHAAFEIRDDHFLILAVDEQMAQASGCGIDKSVRHFQDLGSQLGISFFNRTEVFYSTESQTKSAPIHQFWAMRKAGIIAADTPVFDTTIQTLGDLKTKWLVPFDRSWHQEMWNK